MVSIPIRLVNKSGWRYRLRRLLNPPTIFSRCSGCHSVKVTKYRRAPEGPHYYCEGTIPWGTWQAIPASWASAKRARIK